MDREGLDKTNSPAMLANYRGGLYAGPTSAATHLMVSKIFSSALHLAESKIG